MNECKIVLDKLNKAIKTIENMIIYDLILSIETAYQLNKELLAFDYQYNDSSEDKMSFYNTIHIYPINDEGFEDFLVSRNFLSLIGDFSLTLYNKEKKLPDILNKQEICKKILNDFKYIQSVEDRFSIYEKHTFGLIPGIKYIINEFKQANFIANNFESPVEWEEIRYNNKLLGGALKLPKSLNAFKNGIKPGYTFYSFIDNLYQEFNKFKSFIYIEELVSLLHKDSNIEQININLRYGDLSPNCNAILFTNFHLKQSEEQPYRYSRYEKGTVYNSFWVDPKYLAIDRKIRSSFSIQPNSDLTDILPLLSYFKITNTDIEALLASHDKHLISKHITDTVIEDKPVRRL